MSNKLSIRSDGYTIASRIAHRTEFRTYGAMAGETPHQSAYSYGWLTGSARRRWENDAPQVDYSVWSYGTPIAWHTVERGWVIIGHSFSVSSGRHASHARWGVSRSEDERMTWLQVSYGLSDAQNRLLLNLRTKRPFDIVPNRYQKRSVPRLLALGLIEVDNYGRLAITINGSEAWS